MYVSSMNGSEVIAMYDAEKEACRRKARHILDRCMRDIRKARQMHRCFACTEYWKNPLTQSEYILAVITDTKTWKDKPGLLYLPIVRDRGINLLFTNSATNEVLWLTPHFFDRYKERHGDDGNDYDRIKLLEYYVCSNWNVSIEMADKERNGATEWEVKISDGAIMCQRDDDKGILYGKTYVTEDMMYAAQRDRMGDLQCSTVATMKTAMSVLRAIHGYNTGIHTMVRF